MKCLILMVLGFGLTTTCSAQNNTVSTYPTHWWVSMNNPSLQVMLHGKDLGDAKFTLQYPGVTLVKTNKAENTNYVFLDIKISPAAKPGIIHIKMNDGNTLQDIPFQLKARRKGNGTAYAQGVTSKDFMYLILPDRFSNGDETNDRVPGMRDQSLNRDTVYDRHGGDLQGVEDRLDYLQSLAVTAIWLNPVLENDMPHRTEHGYAFTNHYKIEPRIGGEKAYQQLIDAVHKKGMKIVQDAVYNHVGSFHFTVQDPPTKDWLHQWQQYTNTTYKDQVLFDPHASAIDKKIMEAGWFTRQMPDLNQGNPFVANFLIQHAIWTVEEFGIDGWRIDTYAYNDLDFMNRCNKALMDEYPQLTMFGETWVHGVPNQSYFVQNNYSIPFKSNLQAATDFQTLWGITDAMTKDFGWTDGVNNLYTTLAQDFVYKDPFRNVIFLDNHDMARFYSVVGEDISKYKSALDWLLTCRGIPQLYYGAEIGLTGTTSPNDGYVRQDFPGGWKSDTTNKFLPAGRSVMENEIWNHIATLANFRKNSTALATGKLMQFVPEDGIYVFFRYDDTQSIMVVLNTSKEQKKISFDRYTERTKGFTRLKDIHTGKVEPLSSITLDSYHSGVYELIK